MWPKIYVTVLAVCVLAMAFSSFYAWSWLGSIGIPADAASGYVYHVGVAWPLLWITTLALLFLANAVFWTRGSAWALWTTFAYFALFIAVRFFWLEGLYLDFISSKLLPRSTTGGIFMATVLILLMGAIVFFDQFLITRARHKTLTGSSPVELGDLGHDRELNARKDI